MPARNAFSFGQLVTSILELAYAQIVVTSFLEFAVYFPYFSSRIFLGSFSILLYEHVMSIY